VISFVVVSLFVFVLNTFTDLMLFEINRWMKGIRLFVVHFEDINEKMDTIIAITNRNEYDKFR
jgi:hypothetical protein